jgi:hypothetical protein
MHWLFITHAHQIVYCADLIQRNLSTVFLFLGIYRSIQESKQEHQKNVAILNLYNMQLSWTYGDEIPR